MGLNLRQEISLAILLAFLVNSLGPLPSANADDFRLPAPGVMVRLSPPLDPPILKGIKVHPDNPFRFDFILDKGDSQLGNDQLKNESTKLIKYFLASLTIPEKDLWVNLSPYEKDRITPQSFGLTEMGRDLLAEDYMLKQITASLIYPEGEVGKRFWKRIYEEAAKKFGTTNVPVNTFNKVWIVPEKAMVYENAKTGAAYVVESRLKVMLEQDYLSLVKHEGIQSKVVPIIGTSALGSQIVREIVIPQLTREVNEDKNFARLRQAYNSLILATWYKKKIKDSILVQVYADKNKVAGVGYKQSGPLNDTELIYRRYLHAFKKGVYNYIKEEQDPITQETIPRKYFSGGLTLGIDKAMAVINKPSILKNILRASFSALLLVTASCSIGLSTDQFNKVHSNQQIQLIADQTPVFQDERERSAFAGTGQVVSKLEDARAKPLAVATIAGDIAFHFKDRSKTGEDHLKTEEIAQGYQYALPSDLTVQEARRLMESIQGLPVGDQSLSEVISQSILPWTARPPQESLQRQMEILTGDPSSQMTQETSVAVARAVEGIKIELGTLLYWRGVQIFSQELSDGKINLKNLQEDIKIAEGLGEQEISDAQEKAIRQIVAMMRRLPGGVDISFKEAIPQSFPQIGRVTGEINCVLRSALTAFYLHNLGIKVWSLRMSGHQTLLAQLRNGQYLIVEPSSPKIYPFSIAKVNLPFSAQALEFGKFVYLDEYHQDVFVYNWRKGITTSFYNNLAGALSDIGKWNEAVAVYDRAIALSPLEPNLYNNKAITLRMMGRMSEAADAYYRAIVLSFKSVDSPTRITLMGAVALVGIILVLTALKKAKAFLKDRAMNARALDKLDSEPAKAHHLPDKAQVSRFDINALFEMGHTNFVTGDHNINFFYIKGLYKNKNPAFIIAAVDNGKVIGNIHVVIKKEEHYASLSRSFKDGDFIDQGTERGNQRIARQASIDFYDLLKPVVEDYAIGVLENYRSTTEGSNKGGVRNIGRVLMSAGLEAIQRLGGSKVEVLRIESSEQSDSFYRNQFYAVTDDFFDDGTDFQLAIDINNWRAKGLKIEKGSGVFIFGEGEDRAMRAQNPSVNKQVKIVNQAMVQSNKAIKGGIDLTQADEYLQTKDSGQSIKFHLDPAQLAQLQNAPGFVPVIIDIQPLGDLKKFLGITNPATV